MSNAATAHATPSLADVVRLVKPNIMVMALLTAAGGVALAPGAADPVTWVALMVGTALIVGAANTLNMYLERDVDCLMSRTLDRPLPAGRMDPSFALGFGVAQALVSVPLLTFGAGPLTGLLGVLALISYVNIYTPLKQRTTAATLIGAVPGAMPTLMGWTAVTGRIDLGGLLVFAVLFFWQMPHFHAIALFRFKEYRRAGLVTLPDARGPRATRWTMLGYLVLQLAASVGVWWAGVAGTWYLAIALVTGAAYLAHCLMGLRASSGPRWAKQFFLHSIVYLPVVFIALICDASL